MGRKLFIVLCFLFTEGFCQTYRIATKFSDVILSNMSVGMVYSLKKEKGIPYTVENLSDEKKELEVTIEKPSPSQLKENYEPIPDVSWITVVPSKFSLEPSEKIDCDIIISIPPEEKYLNRHFQAMIVVNAAGKPSGSGIVIDYSIANRIRFSTGPRPEKILEEYRQKVLSALDLEMAPMSLFIKKQLSLGKKISLGKDDFPTIQVVNRSKNNYQIEFSIANNPKDYGTLAEYEPIPKEFQIKIAKNKKLLKPKSIQDLIIELEIPNKEEFYNKKYVFIVIGKVKGFDIPIEIFSRIYFSTENK